MIEFLKPTEKEIKVLKRVSNECWINAVNPSKKEIKRLQAIAPIPDEVFHSLLDLDELPVIDKYDDLLFMIIRTPIANLSADVKFTTVPLGIVIADDHMFTICSQENDVVETLKKQNFDYKKIETPLLLLMAGARTYLTYLKEINKDIEAIKVGLKRTTKNEKIFKLLDLQKSLFFFHTSLVSNELLIERLSRHPEFVKYEEDRELIEDVIDENKQAIEMAHIYSSILNGMFDASSSIISNNLNHVIKVLTSFTVIIAIPTLVASVYGMNVPLPFDDHPYAFLIIMAISIIASILGIIFLWSTDIDSKER